VATFNRWLAVVVCLAGWLSRLFVNIEVVSAIFVPQCP